ncbi:MAG: hypothetical protein N2971_05285 [Chlorobi bacterium]|nr:hypothetical protein [Chlorobiota bacterium]
MRIWIVLGGIALGIAVGSFAVRQVIIAEHQREGRQKHAQQIAEQIAQLQQVIRIKEQRRQQQQMLDTLIRMLAKNPEDTALIVPIANLMLQTGDTLGALRFYRRYVDTAKGENVVALTDYAYLLYVLGDRERGKFLTLQALSRAPSYQVALYNMGVMEFDQRRYTQAIRWMKQCRQADSLSPLGQLAQRAIEHLRQLQLSSDQ